jgi:hypothetical protein
MNKRTQLIILSFIVAIVILAGVTFGIYYVKKSKSDIVPNEEVTGDTNEDQEEQEETEEEYTGPEIFKGENRPIAVMIDNEKPAWPHAGLNSAYMLYEITIEGGESRIMALFKDKAPEKIGPVRSSRHYFLDYAMEHDAIYVHFGWSPKAQEDIKSLKINNINGIYDSFYWREPPKGSYHNAFTSMEKIKKTAMNKKYRMTSDADSIIEYNQKDTDLPSGMNAQKVYIKYSSLQNTSYEYDAEKKLYLRSMRGIEHKDRFTGERFVAKNIIVQYVRNDLLDDPEKKGRQELYDIGSGNGYFITDGKAIEIKWTKTTRAGKTIYKDLEGNEIKLNDGITWVQIVPLTGTVTIE